jgi:hypothetical protein
VNRVADDEMNCGELWAFSTWITLTCYVDFAFSDPTSSITPLVEILMYAPLAPGVNHSMLWSYDDTDGFDSFLS